MAANEETVSIDTIKKTLWDSLEALGKNISGETLDALLEMIESGGSAKPFEVDATFAINAQEKAVITLDATAGELYAAAEAGQLLKATASLPIGEEGATISVTDIIPIEVYRLEVSEELFLYNVRLHMDHSSSSNVFYAENLHADDPVVVTVA